MEFEWISQENPKGGREIAKLNLEILLTNCSKKTKTVNYLDFLTKCLFKRLNHAPITDG